MVLKIFSSCLNSMKLNLILLFLLLMIIKFYNCTNYCELQNKLCKPSEKHVGCDSNEFPFKLINPFTLQKMTFELRNFILNEYNTFRNDVANGKYLRSGLPTASNMRSIRWNEEFEYLAGKAIQNLDYGDFTACIATLKFPSPSESHSLYQLENTDISIDELFSAFVESKVSNKTKWPELTDPTFYEIGCSYGLADNVVEKNYVIKCYSSVGVSFQNYSIGVACSECIMWKEICSVGEYSGLCDPNPLAGLKGERGEIGLTGPRGKDGLKGNQGEKGNKGDRGIDGSVGLKGNRGELGGMGGKGDKGDIGRSGKDGNKGEPGKQGDKGNNGLGGSKGDKGERGYDGISGQLGEQGKQGEKGDQGVIGIPGVSGQKGESGSDGIPGLDGSQGEKGDTGEKGARGIIGHSGEKGNKGDAGHIGHKGDTGIGIPGIDGSHGPKGERGSDGAKGERGLQGIPGIPGIVENNVPESLTQRENNFQFNFPISFWILYCIVALGVFSSCVLTISINYFKKPAIIVTVPQPPPPHKKNFYSDIELN